jgi:hypothetical protein
MESHRHLQMKRLAASYLVRHGYAAVATEVRCPIARHRIDVAGWLDAVPLAGWHDPRITGHLPAPAVDRGGAGAPRAPRLEPRSIVIECKQSRADFLRDSRHMDRLIKLRMELERMLTHIEDHCIKAREPSLRRSGSSLFAAMESWDFASSRNAAYHKTLEKLQRVESRLYGQTKFAVVARYRLADRMFVLAPRGLVRPRELPWGWGLLICPASMLDRAIPRPEDLDAHAIEIAIDAPEHAASPTRNHRLLRNIAVAATRAMVRGGLGAAPDPHRITLFDPA